MENILLIILRSRRVCRVFIAYNKIIFPVASGSCYPAIALEHGRECVPSVQRFLRIQLNGFDSFCLGIYCNHALV